MGILPEGGLTVLTTYAMMGVNHLAREHVNGL
jgi:hypothetical protein